MSAKIPPKNSPKSSAAKPGKDTVYIDADDEITAIIDKVENAKQNIVALVLPKRAATLQSIVNMRLLKRSATTAGKNVVLITSEAALLPLAGAAGLHVARNLQSKPEIPPPPHGAGPQLDAAEEVAAGEFGAEDLEDQPQKLDYNAPIGKLASQNEEPEEITLDDTEEDSAEKPAEAAAAAAGAKKASKGKGLKIPDFDRFRLLLFGGIAALIALIIFIFLATKVLPHAKVIVKTTSTPVSLDTELTTSGSAKQLDEANKIIPSVLKTSDQTANSQVNATGKKNLGDKATGSVTMSAKKCSGNPFLPPADVPAGTGISNNGLSYITQDGVSFHGTGTSGNCYIYQSDDSVDITAQSPGANYNVDDGTTFSVPGRSDVTATGSADGGTDKNVTVVTQQDVDSAKQKISSSDSDKFSKDFQNDLKNQGYYVIASSLKVGEPTVTSTPAVGQQADSASVNVKITYSVLVVQKDDLQKFVKDALNKQIDTKKEKLSDNDVLSGLNVSIQSQQANSADATLSLSKDSAALPILNEDAIKAQIKGKKESQIKSYLSGYPGVKDVEVDFSPFWVSKSPNNAGKITIVEQQVTQGKK